MVFKNVLLVKITVKNDSVGSKSFEIFHYLFKFYYYHFRSILIN